MAEQKSDHSAKHDSHDENGYKKRCYCEKCKRTYDEWCKSHKDEGKTQCVRKCYTICEIACEKPITKIVKWGYKQEFEGEWEPYHHAKPAPKHCNKCRKESKDCSCRK